MNLGIIILEFHGNFYLNPHYIMLVKYTADRKESGVEIHNRGKRRKILPLYFLLLAWFLHLYP